MKKNFRIIKTKITHVAKNNSELSDFIILSRAKRALSLLTARGLSQLRNLRLHKSLSECMLGIRQ